MIQITKWLNPEDETWFRGVYITNLEWLMIDASHVKVHAHGTGAVGGNQDMNLTKGGSTQKYTWPWMRMVCRSEFLLQVVPQLIVSKLRP